MASTETSPPPAAPDRARSPLFAAAIGLAGLGILLQGVWAGLFIRNGTGFRENWVNVHSVGATVVTVLALAAVVVAFLQLRSRREVLIGSIVYLLLLILEGFLGGMVSGSPALEAVHIPLALLLMGMTAWLSLRASRRA